MAITNHERVGKALDFLTAGLKPFVERERKAANDLGWFAETSRTAPAVRCDPAATAAHRGGAQQGLRR